jgi:VTC domain
VSIESPLAGLPSVSLEQLDERASLLKRTDNKYLIDDDGLLRLLDALAGDHEVLEIDAHRQFAYASVYFDTAQLRCFEDHVQSRVPRFKIRTRLYRDTGHCVFEVKLKTGDGQTDKRQIEHRAGAIDRLGEQAVTCLTEALRDAGIAPPARNELAPSLSTQFTRFTLAPSAGSERLTCDRGIVLERADAGRARLREGMTVVETKSENGNSPADMALQRLGVKPSSMSKYRTGIALLAAEAHDPESPTPAERCFEVER